MSTSPRRLAEPKGRDGRLLSVIQAEARRLSAVRFEDRPSVRQEWDRQLPEGDVRLRSGKVLSRTGDYAPNPYLRGGVWESRDGLRVIARIDDTPNHGMLMHVSLSYKGKDPNWTDIKQVRAAFYPTSVDVMMVLPREEHYVNLMSRCWQMWECPTEWNLG